MHSDDTHWGRDGVRLLREADVDTALAQSLAISQVAALTHLPTGITESPTDWLTLPPGAAAVDHGPLPDASLYIVLRGEIALHWGENLDYAGTAAPGEMVLIPPGTRHRESNSSITEELERLLVRTSHQCSP